MRLTSQTGLPKCVSVWLFTFETLSFPLKSSLEFFLHREKPKFISLPVKFSADRSKYININLGKRPFVLAARCWRRFEKPS